MFNWYHSKRQTLGPTAQDCQTLHVGTENSKTALGVYCYDWVQRALHNHNAVELKLVTLCGICHLRTAHTLAQPR